MSKSDKGILTIISGFSGAGKGTVVKELLARYPDRFRLSISATTRQPREGEVAGVHYFYKSVEEFEEMIKNNQLLEYAQYVSNYYGTPRAYVEEKLEEGYDVILEIEQQGAFQVKKAMPEAMLIFLTPPSIEVLEERLRGRQTETEEVIQSRLQQASIEAENIDLYDYLVINDDLDSCVEAMSHLIAGERNKTGHNKQLIQELQDGLQEYKKGE